ncbi:MAG: bifunctional UDP-N-acetylglucosamine diphosphorylase/glucosamine-1-phosphate N-acetyltransferase GlmU, partial [Candidatus Omnitrophica bacterium]|nr:bifunctional UDP-N-acetylglucosamine diphosphorylase/glucosamine-1-phosphate N-acetyltransferase GlmU [Candidatus Omnitrophota bacterium]
DDIRKRFSNFDIIPQSKPLGSANAVNSTKKYFQNFTGDILVLYSDTPLLKCETLKKLIKTHREGRFSATFLATNVSDPTEYGRVVRDEKGEIVKIVEEKDITLYEEVIGEINIGTYCFKKEALFSNLDKIKMNKKKKEYYLTDIIEILKKAKQKVGTFTTEDPSEGIGINSKRDLARANDIARIRVLDNMMAGGITIVDPASTYIDFEAKIGIDTIIYPHTIIEKNVEIGENCSIGPSARVRSGTRLDNGVHIGNFVELVRTKVGSGCKIKHMAYLGDAILGKNINIGAGTITANFDGKFKNKTIIKDNAFIGVGSILIAPVGIGKNAVVGAGSVVTKRRDVPDGKTVAGVPAKILHRRTK